MKNTEPAGALPLPFSGKNYHKNESDCSQDEPCAICGKGIRSPTWYVRVVDGGGRFASEEEVVPEASDMGWHAIGNTCIGENPALRAIARLGLP